MQRGHNRQTIFISDDDDYNYYRENLIYYKQEFKCKIYSYCLMTNHVHLVVDPGGNPEGLSQLMKHVAGRQTRYVNKLEKRTGSLWEGRFKSSIVSQVEYLAACCRYIDLNPLRAGMVSDLSDYRWSSYCCKGEGKKDLVVDFDSFYLSQGNSATERQEAYAEYVLATVPEYELKLIRDSLQRGQLTGSNRFREEISLKLGIRFSNKVPGRPGKIQK
jgi:putative transposase